MSFDQEYRLPQVHYLDCHDDPAHFSLQIEYMPVGRYQYLYKCY